MPRLSRVWSVPVVLALFACRLSAGQNAPADQPLDKLLSTRISTASKYEQTVTQAPASVTIISAEEIRRYGWETLADLMQAVRGFYISYDRNYHYVGVRGFSRPTDYNNRLLLLLDGHPLNENVFGSAPFGSDLVLDLDALERVEIVRGPGSSLYGTGAMFAVVNLIPKHGAELAGATATASAGSLGKKRAGLYGGTERGRTDVMLSTIFGRISGRDVRFKEYPGEVANDLDFDDFEGALASIRNGGLTILANHVSRRKGVPTGAFGVDFNADSETIDERTLGEVQYEKNFGPRRKVSARAFANQYHYDGTYPYGGVPWLDRGDGRWMGGELEGRIDLRFNHRLTSGVEYTDNRDSSYEFGPEDRSEHVGYAISYRVISIYGEDEYQPLENLSFTAGFRYDDYSHLRRNAFSPRASVIWDADRNTVVKLVYGRAFRAPSTYELAYIDPLFGGVQGNPRLEAEKIDTWETMIERRVSESLWVTLGAFEYRMRGLVDPRESGGVLRFENIGNARAHGFEAEVHSRHGPLWSYASYSWQNAKEDGATGRTSLTNSPKNLLKGGISSPLGSCCRGAIEAFYESSRLTVHGSRTDRTFLANANFGWKVQPRIELTLRVKNLFNADYATPAGFEHRQDAIRQDGRTLTVKLELSF